LVGSAVGEFDLHCLDEGRFGHGREEHGCYVHAVAISDLLSGRSMGRPGELPNALALSAGALAGVASARARRRRRSWLSLLVVCAAPIVLVPVVDTLFAFGARVLLRPVPVFLSFWLAYAVFDWIGRVATDAPRSTSSVPSRPSLVTSET
jgi:CHASE2 domain-containing sensor protein